MTIPSSYSFTKYLLAKQTVDDRALNHQVWQWLLGWLRTATPQPLQILELGAGTGAMAERLLRADVLHHAIYTAIDADPETIAQARRHFHLPTWATEQGVHVIDEASGLRLRGSTQDIAVRFETADLFAFIAREQGRQTWDLLIAHALLDLLDLSTALPLLFSILRPGGYFYFPITFDGASILEPAIDPAYDAHIEALYHATMDQRVVQGKPSGDSRSGRRLFAQLRTSGAEVLAAGSSDWVVFAGPNGYPADEAYFLHYIIHTIHTALATHAELDPERFERWIQQRHAQVEDQTLVYIAHQLDIVGRTSTQPAIT